MKCTNCGCEMDKVMFGLIKVDYCHKCKLVLYDMQRDEDISERLDHKAAENEEFTPGQ